MESKYRYEVHVAEMRERCRRQESNGGNYAMVVPTRSHAIEAAGCNAMCEGQVCSIGGTVWNARKRGK